MNSKKTAQNQIPALTLRLNYVNIPPIEYGKTMKERIFSGLLQRAVGCCETVHERKLTASGVGFVNGLLSQ